MAKEIADNEKLGIDSVINNTCGLTENILYATPIDLDETTTIINQLQSFFSGNDLVAVTTGLIDAIDPCLEKTKSPKFYSDNVAEQNISNMSAIGNSINNLTTYVNDFDVTEITNTINNYNECLKNLKKNARKKLLEEAADAFNEKKEEWKEQDYPKTKTYKTVDGVSQYPSCPSEDPNFNYCIPEDDHIEEYSYEVVNSNSSQDEIKDCEGNVVQTIYNYSTTYKVHKYKKIKYWDFFKIIQSPFDPSFLEIEAMFDAVGCKVPYNRENLEVKADTTKNDTWGLNI